MSDGAPATWYKSLKFTALWQSTVLTGLGFVLYAVSTSDWASWKQALLIPVITNIYLTLKDWWSPTIVAPIARLNAGNVTPEDQRP